jgi:hypothetical protein
MNNNANEQIVNENMSDSGKPVKHELHSSTPPLLDIYQHLSEKLNENGCKLTVLLSHESCGRAL